MSSDDPRRDKPSRPDSIAGAYSPPARSGGLASNPWMVGALLVLAVAVGVFVIALAVG